jgi:F0F1-type ATP synthase membrane subunit c/vacuolar-type H+-ATPase subunit K
MAAQRGPLVALALAGTLASPGPIGVAGEAAARSDATQQKLQYNLRSKSHLAVVWPAVMLGVLFALYFRRTGATGGYTGIGVGSHSLSLIF